MRHQADGGRGIRLMVGGASGFWVQHLADGGCGIRLKALHCKNRSVLTHFCS